MTQPNDDTSGATKTFTQADLDRAAAAGAQRARAAAAEKYADYDDLKKMAEAAKGNASQLDKLTEAVTQLTTRAEKAENANMRREIADEFGLTAREARRLSGSTADELRTDAEEMIADLGIDVKARKAAGGKAVAKANAGTNEGEGSEGEAEEQDGDAQSADGSASRRAPASSTRTARPREDLRSGAPRTPTLPEETNPLKLAEMIPRR